MKSASLDGVAIAAAAGVGGPTEGSWTDLVPYPAFSSCAQREEKCSGEWQAPGMMAMVGRLNAGGCARAAIGWGELVAKMLLGVERWEKRVDASFHNGRRTGRSH